VSQAERFSWWKMPGGFYKRHDVQAIGTGPLGRRICDCYVRMLAESVDHEGCLRFSEERPYTTATLAKAIRVPRPLLRLSRKRLTRLGLLEVDEDGTLFLPFVVKRIGTKSTSAERTQEYRRRKKAREKKQEPKQDVTPCDVTSEQGVTPVTKRDVTVTSPSSSFSISRREEEERENLDITREDAADELRRIREHLGRAGNNATSA
jgi:hypothetical protein